MKTAEAKGRVTQEGRLLISPYEKAAFLNAVSKLRGRSVTVQVRVSGKPRSNPENRYYWGVVVELVRSAVCEEWGEPMTKDEAHNLLKQQCNWVERVNEATGEAIRVASTTTSLSTVEFEEYLERCRRFAAEFLNIAIPLPNEQLEIDALY